MQNLKQPGIEPSISELMDDPILQLVLKRDGLDKESVHQLVACASQRLDECRRAA